MFKQIFMIFVGFAMMCAVFAVAFVYRKPLAMRVLNVQQAGEEKWAASEEIQALITMTQKVQEQAKLGEKDQEGRAIDLSKAESTIEDALAKFDLDALRFTLGKMSSSSAAYVLNRIPDTTTRDLILKSLPPEKMAEIQDWMNLRRVQEQLNLEKNALLKQKKRMEVFQSSLEKQQRGLRDMQIEVLEAVKAVREIQARIDQQFLTIEESEQSNLFDLAQKYNEMTPEAVVQILQEGGVSEQTFIKVLSMMENENAAAVLNTLDPRIAARVTEILRVLRRQVTQATAP